MQKFETPDEARRYIAGKLGSQKVAKEANMPYQTVSRFISPYKPPVRRSTENLIAVGSHNAAVSKIQELSAQIKELKEMVEYCKTWIKETQ